ncbi:hypothetical protein LBMAG27_17480 [Bacteroidota bacterium]|nr:hypothetical protein LBMAG27_17480 [Bacteroidota bacterium]
MKQLLADNAKGKDIIIRKNILIEPTIDSLKQQRNYHITQIELHQCELTMLEAKIRKYKQGLEGETIADIANSMLKLNNGYGI